MVRAKQKPSGAKSRATEREVPESVLSDLTRRIGYQLRRAHGRSNELYVQLLGKEKVAPGQYGILKIISLNPGRIQKDIAAIAGMDSTTLVPIVEILERRGWIDRVRDPADRRNLVLSVTAAGTKAVGKLDKLIEAHEDELTRALSTDEQKMLLLLLAKVSGLAPG